jgi:flagellar biosynthetic protein FliP
MRFIFLLLSLSSPSLFGEIPQIPVVDLTLGVPQEPEDLVSSLNVIALLTLLFLAPSLLLITTVFTRFLIVFGLLRQALGTQQMPPTQVLVSLSLIMTVFIMEPVGKEAYAKGIEPYMEKKIGYEEAFERATKPFKMFMVRNTREKDLALFIRMRNMENPKTVDDLSLSIVIPAFIISELKTAFEIGFLLFLPFLVIDMVVSSILMSMGMMMLPPVMISLPFKILVFVMIDGWNLLIANMVKTIK